MSKTMASVVYQIIAAGKEEGHRLVCEQSEWDALEKASPGKHQLIRAGMVNEAEAERLARGMSGDGLKSGYAKKVSR